MLIAVAQIIPPLQSPDENAHLTRAYAITQGQWFLSATGNQSSGALVDQGLIHFMDGYLRDLRTPGWRPSTAQLAELHTVDWQGQKTFFPAPATSYYNPIAYIPQALGLWLGQKLGLSVSYSYALARTLTTLVVFAIIALAWRLFEPNALAIGLLILPMSLFQILMPTIDGLCHALTLLCLCWFCAIQDQKVSKLTHAGFALLLVLLITSRIHAMPLLLLLLLLGPKNGISALRSRLTFSLSVIAVVAWALWAVNHTVDLRIWRALSTMQIVQFYLTHPQQWWSVLAHTLSNEQIVLFYQKTFIGVLGWLHIDLPQWYYSVCTIWLIGLTCLSIDLSWFTKNRLWREHLLFLVMAILSMMLIWNMLLFTWTPFPHPFIEGVQGRYFWIPTCIFAFGLGRKPSLALSSKILLSLALALNVTLIFSVYFAAYH